VRPPERPRTAGTAAWPSETVAAPATFSNAWARFTGERPSRSRAGSKVAPLAGGPSRLGALPAVTVTDSSNTEATSTTSGCSGGPSKSNGAV